MSRWTGTPLDEIWEGWSVGKLDAVYEAVRGAMYAEALPPLLGAFSTLRAHGVKTEWEEFVPTYLRPDPLARLALLEETLRDIAIAMRVGHMGSREVARLYKLFGPEAIRAIEERYAAPS